VVVQNEKRRYVGHPPTATADMYQRRNPKALLTSWMQGSNAYHENTDQVALATAMDLALVRDKCASFRRLITKIERHRLDPSNDAIDIV
jgi:hypothetical protein